MQFSLAHLVFLLATSNAFTIRLPSSESEAQLISRDTAVSLDARDSEISEELWKRKGGGGGKGGSSGSSSSSSSSSSSGSSSSSSGSSGSTGGRTSTGTASTPRYGGGSYYGGGSTTAYRSGSRSPLGIAPIFLGASLLAFYPGLWLYGAYGYPYTHPYGFRNRTANQNQTKPVQCYCAQYAQCGCDDNTNTTYMNEIIGDGDYKTLNKSVVTVADVNGTSTILINGTLENDTTTGSSSSSSSAASVGRTMIETSGYWVVAAIVGCTVLLN